MICTKRAVKDYIISVEKYLYGHFNWSTKKNFPHDLKDAQNYVNA